METRVLLAIVHRLYREALREAIVHRFGIEIVAETNNGRQALRQASTLSPDLVILDIGLKELHGAEIIRQLRAERPGLPVVAVSAHSDHPLVLRVLQAGARAFVVADGGLEELQQAVEASLEGRMFLSPSLQQAITRSLSEPASLMNALTPRELEVLQLIAEGKSTKAVAETLTVSTKTVETHRKHIMAKLHLYSVAELTKYAIREGITTLSRSD
jgi:DNA-binding NarL/FixJ family response regulator